MNERSSHYIGGAWVTAASDERIPVLNPATEQIIGSVPAGTVAEVDVAVAAARGAFPLWSATPVLERVAALRGIAAGITERAEEIAQMITAEVGTPIKLSRQLQVGLPISSFTVAADVASEFDFDTQVGGALVVHEPVGVVAAITPWNYPLHQIAAKVSSALAAGCTVVLKPSEVAPLCSYVLAEIIDAAGVPPGVFNMVQGDGPTVGEALARHPDVDMVSFTGSTRAGRRVSELGASNVKRVTLELGGKSANIILSDADLTRAVTNGIAACYLNSGQTCTALTRMLVPRERLGEVAALAKEVASSFALGDPSSAETVLGPLVSDTQRQRVREFIQTAIDEGAELLVGGPEAPEDCEQGYFVKPTIFVDVDPRSSIARDEIFGPVLCIIGYDSEDEAVELANDSDYGLSGGVWSQDEDHARAIARRIRTGYVLINGGGFEPRAPFGGYKQSGVGREFGTYGLGEYLELKTLL